MKYFVLTSLIGAIGALEASGSSLTLVSVSSGTSSVVGANADGNLFLLDEDQILAEDKASSLGSGARLDSTVSYQTPELDDEFDNDAAVFDEELFIAREANASGYSSLVAGKIGNSAKVEADSYPEATIASSSGYQTYGFLYEGATDLILQDGWLSYDVEGAWGAVTGSYDFRVSGNAGGLATTTTGSPYYIDPEIGAISGGSVDAVSVRANAFNGRFFSQPFTDVFAAEGSSAQADAEGFMFNTLFEGLTVRDGEFLSFSVGFNVSAGVTFGSAEVDALNTGSVSLNVLGLVDVDTSALLGDNPVDWLADAPETPTSPETSAVPLPATIWLLIAGVGALGIAKRKSTLEV